MCSSRAAAAVFLILFSLITGRTVAQSGAQNIILDKALEEYDFELPAKNEADITVTRRVKNVYRCRHFSDVYTFRQVFYETSDISDVVVFVDDYRRNDIQPVFSTGVDETHFRTQRIMSVTLPFGSQGMKADVAYKQTYRNPRSVSFVALADGLAVKSKTVVIRVPDWLDMRISEWNFSGKHITHAVVKSGRDSVHTYTINDFVAPDAQPNSPGPLNLLPHLVLEFQAAKQADKVYRYFSSTQDLYTYYHSMLDTTAAMDSAVKALAATITSGLTLDRDKVRAIYHWVQSNVRYVAFEDGIAGVQPDLAGRIIRKKYADCKGMSTLLVALMRSQGLEAAHCWIGTNDRPYDHTLHSQIVDNHMIAAWLDNGTPRYLDATPGWMAFGDLREDIQGRQLLRENGASFMLDRIPVQKSETNLDLEQRTLHYENGLLKGKVKHTLKGQSKFEFLSHIHASGKSAYDQAIRAYLLQASAGYEIANIVTTDLHDRDRDLTISYDVVQTNAANVFDNEHYLDPDNRKQAIRKFDTGLRRMAFVHPHKTNCRLELSITLPAIPSRSVFPDSISVRRDDYGMAAGWKLQGKTLKYHAGYWTENLTIPTSTFTQVNEDFDKLRNFYSRQPELHF